MAQPTNLYDRYDASTNVREDLIDKITMTNPDLTPVVSSFGRATAKNTYHEWQRDALRAPNANNAAIDGDDATASAKSPPVRVANYLQIFQDTIATSGPTVFATLKSSQAVSLRIGRLIQPETLLYASIGRSQMKLAASPDFYPLDGGGSKTLAGWQFGLGLETALSRHLSMRVEGVYTDTKDDLVTTNAQSGQVRLSPSVLSGRIGISYRF